MKKYSFSNSLRTCRSIALALVAAISFNLHADDAEQERPSGPNNGDNPDIGIKYDEAQGLYVTPYSAKLLGLEMEDVDEQEIAKTIQLQARIFDTSSPNAALASAWLPEEETIGLQPGLPVKLDDGRLGEVTGVTSELNGQAEVLLSISDPKAELKAGKFVMATLKLPSDGLVTVVPTEAVVHSAEGAFAYVDNGGWTVRTPVETGAEADGKVEIIDGIYFGDRIVTKPVMSLWMTELQLLKSGKA